MPPAATPPAPPAVSSTTATRPPAPAAVAPRAPVWREVTIPAGTTLPLEITSPLSTETTEVEAPASARVREAVVINGDTVLPAGATVTGNVSDVERPGRVQGRARLVLAFTELRTAAGTEALGADPVTFEGEASKGEDAAKVGIGAGAGAIIGGILGGKSGAGKGAATGAAAGTAVVLATRGKDLVVPAGTEVNAELNRALTIRIPARDNRGL